ncbi:glycosyltransferase family 2 protein [Candidatus Woesearchaeota archaeon]|nr:glycosyltransferase family 2 protein [Candidatus Woesearchaeota archaeon]
MHEQLTICIPTYGKKIRNHLIISRTLNSLLKQPKDNFRVIIFNTTDPFDEKVSHDLSKLVERFKKHFNIILVNTLDLEYLRNFLIDKGVNGIIPEINFKGFSNFRNSMLIVANILRSKLVLMIDDDEVVEDKKFIEKAAEFIGSKFKKKILLGKTGYYLYDQTGYKLKQQSPKTRKLWLKETSINETLGKLVNSKNRLNDTTMAFGGIMVLHQKLYRKIPFDPNILRGEDTDYLINAKQFGYNFALDNKLRIRHRPEKKLIQYWEKLRQDISRFIYTREKLKYFNKISLKSLEPYPASFLRDDIDYRAVTTSINYATRSLKIKKPDRYMKYFENVKIVFTDAKMHAVINAPKYFSFQKEWAKFMTEISKFTQLRKHFDRF